MPSNHFSETDLQTEWKKFIDQLYSKQPIIYSAISGFKLKKLSEDIIEITYPSSSAKSEFDKVQQDFMGSFMRKVSHYNIVIEFRKDITLKQEIITKRKIFDKFAEINPVLRELDDIFKLDFNS